MFTRSIFSLEGSLTVSPSCLALSIIPSTALFRLTGHVSVVSLSGLPSRYCSQEQRPNRRIPKNIAAHVVSIGFSNEMSMKIEQDFSSSDVVDVIILSKFSSR